MTYLRSQKKNRSLCRKWQVSLEGRHKLHSGSEGRKEEKEEENMKQSRILIVGCQRPTEFKIRNRERHTLRCHAASCTTLVPSTFPVGRAHNSIRPISQGEAC